jgi:hypothetical protein
MKDKRGRWKYFNHYLLGRAAYHQGKEIDSSSISRVRLGMFCSWKAGWLDAQTEEEGWRGIEH